MPGPLVAAAIPAIGSLVGGLIQNNANRDMAREQMAFQERMSGTAYQRATEDMRLAGINPMLAYMQGGASSPQGATAQMSDVIGPAVASAQHARRLSAELKLNSAMVEKTREEAKVPQSVYGKNYAEIDLIKQHFFESKAREDESRARIRQVDADYPWRSLKGQAATGAKKVIRKAREIWDTAPYRNPWDRR